MGRLDWILLTGLVLAGLALYLVRLSAPDGYSFDEIYHAYTSAQLVAGNADAYLWDRYVPANAPPNAAYEWTHPALSKLFMQAGIRLLGNKPAGWRLFSAIFGAAGVGLLFVLGRLLFNRTVAVLAAVLLLLDGLWFVMARTAMNDVYVTAFILLAYVCMVLYLTGPPGRRRYIWLTGLALGLAAASKWSSSYSFAILGVLVALREANAFLRPRRDWAQWVGLAALLFAVCTAFALSRGLSLLWSGAWAGLAAAAALALVETAWMALGRRRGWPGPAMTWFGAFVLLPLLVYAAAYFQFFTMGHTPSQFIELQRQMYQYHSSLKATHAWASRWWTWPLMLEPVWFYSGQGQGRVWSVYALANPIIWWGFLPAAAYAIWRWYRAGPAIAAGRLRIGPASVFGVYDWVAAHRSAAGLSLALIGFLGQWLPWALSPRISFIYHMLPSVPFGCLLVGFALWSLRAPRLAILGYMLPVALAFVYFYPLYSALPISAAYTIQHSWMASWQPH